MYIIINTQQVMYHIYVQLPYYLKNILLTISCITFYNACWWFLLIIVYHLDLYRSPYSSDPPPTHQTQVTTSFPLPIAQPTKQCLVKHLHPFTIYIHGNKCPYLSLVISRCLMTVISVIKLDFLSEVSMFGKPNSIQTTKISSSHPKPIFKESYHTQANPCKLL